MSTIERPLSGDHLLFDLDAELARGAGSRTLLKEGPLRVTLVRLEEGGASSEHSAPGPVTIQPLRGRVVVHTDGGDLPLEPGSLLSLAPDIRHSVRSDEGAAFLLTLVFPEGAGAPE